MVMLSRLINNSQVISMFQKKSSQQLLVQLLGQTIKSNLFQERQRTCKSSRKLRQGGSWSLPFVAAHQPCTKPGGFPRSCLASRHSYSLHSRSWKH